jgi:hypothetical protein
VTRGNSARSRREFLCVLVSVAALGCNQRAVESWLSQSDGLGSAPSLYKDDAFSRAFTELQKRVPAPIQALSLLAYPDHLVLQSQDPAAPGNVLQYVYRPGAVMSQATVKLLGTGKLDDNLFPLGAVKVDSIPRLTREAQARANIPEGRVARVLLKRNLPESMDIQFRVFVTSERRDATFDADDTGKLLE